MMLCAAPIMAIAGAADAATRTIDFEVLNGPLAGNAVTGSLEFDETVLDSNGDGDLTSVSGFTSLSLTFEGQTFGLSDDAGFPEYPVLSVEDSLISILDFFAAESDTFTNPTRIDAPGVLSFAVSWASLSDNGATLFGGIDVAYAAPTIPVPASLPLLAAGLGALGLATRRRRG
jgi:hypothetical protein